jgi:hypothetical protein
MVSLIKTMRADMDNPKLYPPGMVYIMVGDKHVGRVQDKAVLGRSRKVIEVCSG